MEAAAVAVPIRCARCRVQAQGGSRDPRRRGDPRVERTRRRTKEREQPWPTTQAVRVPIPPIGPWLP